VQFRKMIEVGTLSAERKERVLRALESLPDGDRICHGDFHAGNIMMTDGGPIVIDCVVAHRGNPRADVAQTCVAMTEWLHLRMSERSREAVARFIEAYERRYFELSPEGQDEVAMWKPIVAAVRYSVPHPPSSEAPLLGMIDGHR
jgi:Ser/Thr protein kinase RdoA (MazF antagonist)